MSCCSNKFSHFRPKKTQNADSHMMLHEGWLKQGRVVLDLVQRAGSSVCRGVDLAFTFIRNKAEHNH